MPKDTAVEELRLALQDWQSFEEFRLLGAVLVEIADKLNAKEN